MNLAERRARLVTDIQAATAQRDQHSAAAREAATHVERLLGALALIDELLAADDSPPRWARPEKGSS
jgi:hypothetical protein